MARGYPPRKRYYASRKRKTAAKKILNWYRAKKRGTVVVPKTRYGGNSYPFGQSFRTRLVYTQTQTLSGGTWLRSQIFRGNSVYDPDYTGTGSQPLGFDELCPNLFQGFRVLASKIVVSFINNGTVPTEVTVSSQNLVTAPTTLSSARAAPGAKQAILLPTGGQSRPATISQYRATHYVTGVPRVAVMDEDYTGSDTQNPSQQWYWHINTAPMDGVTASNVTLSTKIIYYVEFIDRKRLALS